MRDMLDCFKGDGGGPGPPVWQDAVWRMFCWMLLAFLFALTLALVCQ